jgi:hypothetical protein
VFDRTNELECGVEIHPKKEKKKGTEKSVGLAHQKGFGIGDHR